MITMKQTGPEEFSLMEDGKVAGFCRFTSETGALVILGVKENYSIPGLNMCDALLRAAVSFTLPLGFERVVCRNEAMFDKLAALRFERVGESMVSTPDEVLRHLCKHD